MALKAELYMTTFERANAGDASMMGKALKLLDKADAGAVGRAAKKVKLGKKEQAKQDALQPTPGTPLGELMAKRSGGRLDG